MLQWLGVGAFTAMGPGSIPGRRTKILQAVWHGQKKKKVALFKSVSNQVPLIIFGYVSLKLEISPYLFWL